MKSVKDAAGIALGLGVQGVQMAFDPTNWNIGGVLRGAAAEYSTKPYSSPQVLEDSRRYREEEYQINRDIQRKKESLDDCCKKFWNDLGQCLQALLVAAIIVLILGLVGIIALLYLLLCLLWKIGILWLLLKAVFIITPAICICLLLKRIWTEFWIQ